MTPAVIIQQATADGVILGLTPSGTIKATGNGEAIKRWLEIIREHKPAIVAALAEAANDEATRRWRVHFPNLAPMEVIFCPDATRAEVEAIYHGATIEPLSDPPRRTATPAEREELARLLAAVLPGDPASQAEALTIALADIDNALVCFRRLADEGNR